MKKIKKYDWGTFSASAEKSQMVNPGNAALKQYTTTSSSTIPTGALPTTGDISQVAYSSKNAVKKPSFGDKAGNFLENYGGSIANLSTALLPLLLKRKKANERPYEEGTKNLNINMKKKTTFKKYQMGTPNLAPQGTQKSVMDTASNIGNSFQAANQNLVNQGVGMAKNVMGANQNLMNQGAGLLNKANDFHKNMAGNVVGGVNNAVNKATGAVGNFAQSQMKKPGGALNLLFPQIGAAKSIASKIFNKGTKMIKYQEGANNLIGPGPLDNLPEMNLKQIQDFINYDNKYGYGKKEIDEAIQRVNRMGAPISPLAPKMASIKMPQEAPMSPRPSKVPVEKITRRERKENVKKDFASLKRDQKIETLSPMMARISPEVSLGSPKKVEVEAPTKKIKYFDYTTKEAKGGYARALKNIGKDGKVITTKEGWLTDPETGLVYKDLRGKSFSKSGGAKPSVPPAGQELVRMSRMGENPLYNKSVGVPEPIKRNYPKKIDKENFQPIGLGEKYQAGTKSLTKDEGKVGKGSEYFALAKTLTPEQKAEFRKLDAQAKKEGKTFSFQGLKYDPAAYAAAMSKGKGASKGSAKADTPKTAQHTTDDPGKKMKNPEDLSRYAFGEKPITFMGDTFSIRPSTLEKAGQRGAAVLGSLAWGPLAVPTLGAVGTASLIDAVNELTPRGSNFETYLSNLSKTLDIGASLAGAAGTAVGVGKGLGAGYGAVKNPREALKKIKELWKNKMQMTGKPLPQMTKLGKSSAKTTQLNLPI